MRKQVSVQNSSCESFAAIAADEPEWMILGTMPSVESLKQEFYYAHPRNAFWPILQSLTNQPVESTEDKIKLIKSTRLVLWDVLKNCTRPGSLDSAITQPSANDFESFLQSYPKITTIVFNGKKAQQLFNQYVLKQQQIASHINYIVLPSTSPANAAISKQDKQLFWQEKLLHLV